MIDPNVPTIREYMTEFPHSVSANDPISVAQSLMKEHQILHLPVLRDGKPFSVVSDREIATVFAACGDSLPAERRFVEDFCSLDAYIVDATTPLKEVVLEMARRHIGSTIVTIENRLAGIFTATDACRVLGDAL